MGRQLFVSGQLQSSNVLAHNAQATLPKSSGLRRNLNLATRPAVYLDALASIDSHSSQALFNPELLHKVIDESFPNPMDLLPLGIIAKCYLGHPYEVHTIMNDFTILKHFEAAKPLPDGMEQLRSLAMNEAYRCIEVYSNKFICITKNGTAIERDR